MNTAETTKAEGGGSRADRPLLGFRTEAEKLRDLQDGKLHYLPRGVVRPQYAMTHPYVPDRLRAVKEELFGVADYMDYLNTPQ